MKRQFLMVVLTETGTRAELHKKLKPLIDRGEIARWESGESPYSEYMMLVNGRRVNRAKLKDLHENSRLRPWGFVDLDGSYKTPITKIGLWDYIEEMRQTLSGEVYVHAVACEFKEDRRC